MVFSYLHCSDFQSEASRIISFLLLLGISNLDHFLALALLVWRWVFFVLADILFTCISVHIELKKESHLSYFQCYLSSIKRCCIRCCHRSLPLNHSRSLLQVKWLEDPSKNAKMCKTNESQSYLLWLNFIFLVTLVNVQNVISSLIKCSSNCVCAVLCAAGNTWKYNFSELSPKVSVTLALVES